MRKGALLGLTLLLLLLAGAAGAAPASAREQAPQAADQNAISFDNWLAAKTKAEEYDKAGKYVEALQYYLEYTRQAQGLGRPDLVAWGKNNAAFMIIKRHKLDATVNLAPAKKLLEEAMAVGAASDECKKCLEFNMEYVKLFLKD
jgi:hypothetical protein